MFVLNIGDIKISLNDYWGSFHLPLYFQIQLEKEKVVYELENVQSQLDKVIAQSARLQKEKETAQVDADRLQDKYEKVQVSK